MDIVYTQILTGVAALGILFVGTVLGGYFREWLDKPSKRGKKTTSHLVKVIQKLQKLDDRFWEGCLKGDVFVRVKKADKTSTVYVRMNHYTKQHGPFHHDHFYLDIII